MNRTILFSILLLFAGILLNSCSKTVDPVWMIYEEENCRPPWVGNTDYKTRKNLEAALRADGVIPLKIKIKGNRTNSCNDCFCLTGKTYFVQVDRSQMSYVYYYGFSAK
ncbi:MAG: hypothetical protein HUJ25_14565 [Crocinitomicaceae bacterium]|nr:hypothetical protein [Crocinitomicaceae bacterium]